jgi:hypothetical protein
VHSYNVSAHAIPTLYIYICTSLQNLKKFFKKDNSVKNHKIMTKFELNSDLCVPVIYPNVKFELNVCNCCRDNEWKLNNDGMTMTEQCNAKFPCPFHVGGIKKVNACSWGCKFLNEIHKYWSPTYYNNSTV